VEDRPRLSTYGASGGVLPPFDHAAMPPTILICEDEPTLRELVRATLGPGYEFVEAVDGDEAAQLIREVRPSLIVLDLMLPRVSGLELLGDLRADETLRDTPVVVLTAWSHAEDAALVAGADRFLAKPFEPDELKSAVDELLAER
jgi:CheY-like chemotaxis protein